MHPFFGGFAVFPLFLTIGFARLLVLLLAFARWLSLFARWLGLFVRLFLPALAQPLLRAPRLLRLAPRDALECGLGQGRILGTLLHAWRHALLRPAIARHLAAAPGGTLAGSATGLVTVGVAPLAAGL